MKSVLLGSMIFLSIIRPFTAVKGSGMFELDYLIT